MTIASDLLPEHRRTIFSPEKYPIDMQHAPPDASLGNARNMYFIRDCGGFPLGGSQDTI